MSRTINIDKILIKRGNTAAISTYTGPKGELVMDTSTNILYLQDGETVGGISIGGNVDSIIADYTGTIGSLEVTGNVTSNYFVGDGSQLTNIYSDSNVAEYLLTDPTVSDIQSNIDSLNNNIATINSSLGNISSNNLEFQTYANASLTDLNNNVSSISTDLTDLQHNLSDFGLYANLAYAPIIDPVFIHDATVTGNLYAGNLFLEGNTTVVNTENLSITDNIINLHSPNGLIPLSFDDGKDIGFAFHYYKDGDNHAGLVWANDTGYLEYYAAGSDTGNVFVGTEYGTIKAGGFIGNNLTIGGVDIISNIGAFQSYANSAFITEQVQVDWNEINIANSSYIRNQPNLSIYATVNNPTFTGTVTSTGDFAVRGNLTGIDCYISNLYLDGDLAVDYFTGIGDFVNNSNAYVLGYTTTTLSSTANFIGYIDHRNLRISTMISGTITLGMVISGPGVTLGTYIKKFKTGKGGIGEYEVSVDKNVGSKTSLVTFSGTGAGGTYQAGGFLFVDYTITANGLVINGNSTTSGNATVNNITSTGKVTSTNMLVTNQLNVNSRIYGREIYDNNNRVITSVTPNAGSGITLSAVNTTAPDINFTINNAGVTSIVATANETTVDRATGAVTVGLPASVTIQAKLTAGNLQTTNGVFWANGINYTTPIYAAINNNTTNLASYQTIANANAASQATSINSINTNVATLNANLGAYQTWANAQATYGNTQVSAYLPTHTGNVGAGYVNTTNGIYWANGTPYTSNVTVYINSPVTSNVNVGSLDTSIAAGGLGNTTVAYNGSNSVRFFQHTNPPAGAWTMNFTNLGLTNNQATQIKVMLPPSTVGDYLATPSQIDGTTVGVTNTIGTLKASKNKTNIFRLEIIKGSGGAFTIYGDVTSY